MEAHLNKSFKDLAVSVQPYSRCFLDAREMASDGQSAAAEVFERAAAAGMVFTPVTGISRTEDVEAALNHGTYGVAVRLTRGELEAGELARTLLDFMGRRQLALEETDLIIDLGPVDDLVVAGVIGLTETFLQDVPNHQRWRTFTISACAFPSSMGVVDRNSHDLIERSDWMAWRDNLYARRQDILRLPTFSDCAIQHTLGVEGFNPMTMHVSASIRYTSRDDWLIIKGESTRRRLPSKQFPDLATQLVHGHLKPHFAGPNHCSGCASIQDSALGASGLGSPEAWRRIGTIHHITAAMQNLASLP
ncbi:MAG: hypothetical protein O3A47_06215 [Chloroflexi bacterium]|nr:hypothetical protein [Chloroflexota bacterium]